MLRPAPSSTLFPYTTLFRSHLELLHDARAVGFHGLGRERQRLRDRGVGAPLDDQLQQDRKSTHLNSSHGYISYAVFCLKKKKNITTDITRQSERRKPISMVI